MPQPKLLPIEKHKRPFKVSNLELHLRLLILSLGLKLSEVNRSMGWEKGTFHHYYYKEVRVGKKKNKVRLYSIIWPKKI